MFQEKARFLGPQMLPAMFMETRKVHLLNWYKATSVQGHYSLRPKKVLNTLEGSKSLERGTGSQGLWSGVGSGGVVGGPLLSHFHLHSWKWVQGRASWDCRRWLGSHGLWPSGGSRAYTSPQPPPPQATSPASSSSVPPPRAC